jgi:hypothetical protein
VVEAVEVLRLLVITAVLEHLVLAALELHLPFQGLQLFILVAVEEHPLQVVLVLEQGEQVVVVQEVLLAQLTQEAAVVEVRLVALE